MPFSEAIQPVCATIAFSCDTADAGALNIIGHVSGAATTFTLISHCPGMQAQSYDFDGDGQFLAVPFADCQAFVLLAWQSGAIVASGVFEVDCALTNIGQLLIPRSLSNLLIIQEHMTVPQTAPLVAEQAVHA